MALPICSGLPVVGGIIIRQVLRAATWSVFLRCLLVESILNSTDHQNTIMLAIPRTF